MYYINLHLFLGLNVSILPFPLKYKVLESKGCVIEKEESKAGSKEGQTDRFTVNLQLPLCWGLPIMDIHKRLPMEKLCQCFCHK